MIFATGVEKGIEIRSRLKVALSHQREDLRSRSDYITQSVALSDPQVLDQDLLLIKVSLLFSKRNRSISGVCLPKSYPFFVGVFPVPKVVRSPRLIL